MLASILADVFFNIQIDITPPFFFAAYLSKKQPKTEDHKLTSKWIKKIQILLFWSCFEMKCLFNCGWENYSDWTKIHIFVSIVFPRNLLVSVQVDVTFFSQIQNYNINTLVCFWSNISNINTNSLIRTILNFSIFISNSKILFSLFDRKESSNSLHDLCLHISLDLIRQHLS